MKTFHKYWRLICWALPFSMLLTPAARSAQLRPWPVFLCVPTQSESLTAPQHDRILALLAELSLDRENLAALNLSQTQVETLLTAVRTWHATNATLVANLDAAAAGKAEVLRAIKTAVNMGTAEEGYESQLATARAELRAARAARRAAPDTLAAEVATALSASQRAAWEALKSGIGPMSLRVVALTDAQRTTLAAAWKTFNRERMSAAGKEARHAARARWQAALSTALTAEQKATMQSYKENRAAAAQRVASAIDTVLPRDQS